MIEQPVGWAKAHLRRAHHFLNRMSSRRVVGTPPNAFAPGRFAHFTHLRAAMVAGIIDCHDRAFGMCLERKARVHRTTPPPESVVAGWYENASLLDSYSIDLSSSKQPSMRLLAARTVGYPPAWIKALVALRDAMVTPFGVALFGHARANWLCLLLRVQWTCRAGGDTSGFDPKQSYAPANPCRSTPGLADTQFHYPEH